MWWHTPFVPTIRRQRQTEVSLVYNLSSRIASAVKQRTPVSKKKKGKEEKKSLFSPQVSFTCVVSLLPQPGCCWIRGVSHHVWLEGLLPNITQKLCFRYKTFLDYYTFLSIHYRNFETRSQIDQTSLQGS